MSNDTDKKVRTFFMIIGEVIGSSLLLMLFWDVVMERMFGLPNMTLLQAGCVVLTLKAMKHWI